MSIYYDKRHNRWCLDIKVDGQRLQTSAADKQVLVRMQSIIKNNRLTYDNAKKLATDYRRGLIRAGYIGHKYLRPEIGYRIISSYGTAMALSARTSQQL